MIQLSLFFKQGLENTAKTYLFLIFVFRCGGGMKKASQ